MKKCNIDYIGVTIFVFNGLYMCSSNSLLRIHVYNQFGNFNISYALF